MDQEDSKVYRQIAKMGEYALTTNGKSWVIVNSSGREVSKLTNVTDAYAALELLAFPPGTIHSGGL